MVRATASTGTDLGSLPAVYSKLRIGHTEQCPYRTDIIIIIIIAFKGAIRDFLQSPHSAANCPTCTLKWPGSQPCANHVQHIERLSRASVMLRATWYEGTAQLLSLTELNSHLFELYFIG